MRPFSFPTALRSSVFATPRNSDDPQEIFRQINATFDRVRKRDGARLTWLEETVTNLTGSLSAMNRQFEGGFHIEVGGVPLSRSSWDEQVINSEQLAELRNSPVRA